MMFCPACGKGNGPADRYCVACGNSLVQGAAVRDTPPAGAATRARPYLFWSSLFLVVGIIGGLGLAILGYWWSVSWSEGLDVQADEVWVSFVGLAVAVAAAFGLGRSRRAARAIATGDLTGAYGALGTTSILLAFVGGGLLSGILLALARARLHAAVFGRSHAGAGLFTGPLRRPVLAMSAVGGLLLVGAVGIGVSLMDAPFDSSLGYPEDDAVGTWHYYHSPDGSNAYLVLKRDRTGCHIDSWTGGDNNYKIRHWEIQYELDGEGRGRYILYLNENGVPWGRFDPVADEFWATSVQVYTPSSVARTCP